ncbi:uncharacterized protein [Salminus brasiliensis]|uniref:uncharacterized protein n=1 Tax=Salminus brasiliensis TaxID=930266 RepID=UPI003B82D306
MKQTAFNIRRRMLCVVFLLTTISTQVLASIKFVPVGRTIRIPCEGYGNHSFATWSYTREDKSSETVVSERKGITFHGKMIRKKLLRDFYLEISPFTEQDKGIYVCKLCTNTQECTESKPISLVPQYETSPSLETHFVTEGGRFSYSCPRNGTLKVGWTFEVRGGNTVTHLNNELTDKGLLSILDVQPLDAGKYSCWGETLTGQRETVYLLTLCVLTAEEMTDSPQNCTLYCDADVATERDPVVVGTDKGNVSITGQINKPKSSVMCWLHSSSVETDRASLEDHNTTHSGATELRIPIHTVVLTSTCTAAFLVIVALVIVVWLLRQRRTAERTSSRDCQSATRGSLCDENETQVIYSMLEVVRYQQQSAITLDTECVYSQINL